jgi:hypothetical protein
MRESRDSQEPWLSLCPYSPKSLEGRFSKFELPIYGVLRSSEVGRLAAVVRFRPSFLALLEWQPGSDLAGVLANYPSGRKPRGCGS